MSVSEVSNFEVRGSLSVSMSVRDRVLGDGAQPLFFIYIFIIVPSWWRGYIQDNQRTTPRVRDAAACIDSVDFLVCFKYCTYYGTAASAWILEYI
jgi:hypothetical protein